MKKILLACITILLPVSLLAQTEEFIYWGYDGPPITSGFHTNSKIRFGIGSSGRIGQIYYPGIANRNGDAYGSGLALWVGGIVNGDTLVSTSQIPETWYSMEFWPDYPPSGYIKEISPDMAEHPSPYQRPEMSFYAEYTDTFSTAGFVPYSEYDHRFHKPLGVKIKQRSTSYHDGYAEDFVIIEYNIQNISPNYIDSMYVGFYHEGWVFRLKDFIPGADLGDNEGFLDSVVHEFPELGYEQVDVAWCADENGFPDPDSSGNFGLNSLRHVFGIAPLKLPDNAKHNSFNWWVITDGSWWSGVESSWGPRRRGTLTAPLRLFNNQFGIAFTDPDKYYLMAHPEIDYTGYYAGANLEGQGWMAPLDFGADIADGHDVNFLTSYGPFDLASGEDKTVVIVAAVGENFHTRADAFSLFFTPEYPSPFLRTLDQSDLVNNIRWAKRIYDNPGVDTDGDGDSGKFVWRYDPEYGDTLKVYYEGDGIADFAGAKPPPAPDFRLYTTDNTITVRWNGEGIEKFYDRFSSVRDFEGYRVYMSRSELESELTLLASYDREDYNRYKYNSGLGIYELTEAPFTLDSLQAIYGDNFHPMDYTDKFQPLHAIDGSYYYFSRVDYNQSNLTDPDGIHKVYPDATRDTSDVDEEGRMRYYEYEYVINDVLSTIPYYVSVTSFDFGYPAKKLEPSESDPMEQLRVSYGVGTNWDGEIDKDTFNLNVYVYPNPYIADGSYRRDAFESRFTDLIPDRSRAIYFANLPNKCKITIFSIDGDILDMIFHDKPEGSGDAHINHWDMITKSNMTIVSGIYYFVVESEYGNQIGKFAVIR